MKKAITNNLGLKILSIMFSIGLWLAVVNISDPEITTSFSGISVEIMNTDLVTREGKVYSVLDGTDTVSVEVTGKRSLIDTINKDDIHAVADLNDLSFMNTVSIKASSSKYSSQIKVKCATENLKLDIEDVKRVQLPIEIVAAGTPGAGYIVGTMTPDQNIVRISGPQSLVEMIDHVEAEVSVEGWKSDINTSADLRLYDVEGNQIKNSSLTQNIASVKVSVTILETKQVKLSYSVSGIPATGYMVTGEITSVPETVMIAGKKSIIDSLEEIVIADTELNITGQTSDMTSIVDIGKYLPGGISFADSSFSGTASVTVGIEASETRDFDVPLKNIALMNRPADFKVSIEDAEDEEAVITITLTGMASKIIELRDEEIHGQVDMKQILDDKGLEEWTEGVYNVPVKFNLSDDIITNNIYSVRLHVDKNE